MGYCSAQMLAQNHWGHAISLSNRRSNSGNGIRTQKNMRGGSNDRLCHRGEAAFLVSLPLWETAAVDYSNLREVAMSKTKDALAWLAADSGRTRLQAARQWKLSPSVIYRAVAAMGRDRCSQRGQTIKKGAK
jgi:hypothetical protein